MQDSFVVSPQRFSATKRRNPAFGRAPGPSIGVNRELPRADMAAQPSSLCAC